MAAVKFRQASVISLAAFRHEILFKRNLRASPSSFKALSEVDWCKLQISNWPKLPPSVSEVLPTDADLALSNINGHSKLTAEQQRKLASDIWKKMMTEGRLLSLNELNLSSISSVPVTPRELCNLAILMEKKVGKTALFLAAQLYVLAADSGYPTAEFALINLLRTGSVFTQDAPQVVNALTRLAEIGHPEAQFNLGQCYYEGFGVDQSFEKALQLWETLAISNHMSPAVINAAAMYLEGKGAPINANRALDLLTSCAERGNKMAMMRLGSIYTESQGVPANPEAAFKWFKLAADDGVVHAQFNVGVAYHTGIGTTVDIDSAIKYYNRAANQNFTRAQVNLGKLYMEGYPNHLDPDFQLATQYLRAAVAKDPNLKELLEQAEKLMNQNVKANSASSGRCILM